MTVYVSSLSRDRQNKFRDVLLAVFVVDSDRLQLCSDVSALQEVGMNMKGIQAVTSHPVKIKCP